MTALNNKFVIISTYWNAEEYLAKSIDGTLNQSFDDLGVIYYNDGSSDESHNVLLSAIRDTHGGTIQQSGSSNVWIGQAKGKDILYINSSTNTECAALNQKVCVDSYIADTGTICGIVDGDDFLFDHNAVEFVHKKMGNNYHLYASTQRWSHLDGESSMFSMSNKILTQADFPDIVVGENTYPGMTAPHPRVQNFQLNHFRAFRKILSDNVETGRSFYNPTGALIKPASDVAYFKPMIDMAGADKIFISKASHYAYTFESPYNDYTQVPLQQNLNAKFCTYAVSGVVTFANDEEAQNYFTGIGYGSGYYISGNHFSGVEDGKTGYFMFLNSPFNPDGSTGCCTPYDLLNL